MTYRSMRSVSIPAPHQYLCDGGNVVSHKPNGAAIESELRFGVIGRRPCPHLYSRFLDLGDDGSIEIGKMMLDDGRSCRPGLPQQICRR